MKRAVVTGGAGFIGSHVADRLIAEGWKVLVIDDLSAGKRENVPVEAELHEIDFASGRGADLIERGSFDLIVHAAAQMDVRHSVSDPVRGSAINVTGTVRLLEAVRSSGKRGRVVFASTGGALYGDMVSSPTREIDAKEPDSPYGVSKLAGEHYLAFYGRAYGLESLSLRIGNVYGPRQDLRGEAGVVAIFCSRILARQALTVFGDGMQTRDYIHVSDVVDAVLRAANVQLPPAASMDARAFNIGTGIGTTVLDLATRLQKIAGTDLPVEFRPRRLGEELHAFLAIDKARETLSWSPAVALDGGLKETYDWFAASNTQSAHAGAV